MGEGAAAGVTRVSVDPRRGPDPGAERSRSSVSQVLTPELQRAAVRRLKYIGVINVIVPLLILLIDFTFHRPMAVPASRVITTAVLVLATLMGLSLIWLTVRLEPRVLLDIAVVYQIVVGLIISIQSHASPVETQAASRQWPVVAVWMIVFALLIPNTRRKTVIATLATAAMDPLGLCVHLVAGAPAPSPAGWFLIFFPTPLVAVLTIIVSRIVYNLSVEPVFTGTTPLDVLIEHVRTDPTPPSRKASQPIPPALEDVVLSCLAKSPADRPQSARELARRLECLKLAPWTAEDAGRWWNGISSAEKDESALAGEPSLHAGERVAVIQDRPQ
jgi:hypothetical protein